LGMAGTGLFEARQMKPEASDRGELLGRARALRGDMTDDEKRLWRCLRLNALGHKFRRQVPLGRYIVDFVCLEKRLVIELDGGQHLESQRDEERDRWLREDGFRVLRFWNYEVLRDLDAVVEEICRALGREEE